MGSIYSTGGIEETHLLTRDRTEIGGLGHSIDRQKGDDSWDYIRILPFVRPYLWMKPLEDGTYEAVYLKDLPTLAASNSDDPPGSFHSKDLFIPHVTIPHAWKHVGRIDDRLNLSNGEKVLTLPIEGRINADPLVKEAVVFGAGKSIPGLLVFRSDAAKDMADKDFIDAIWPTVKNANAHAESFAQISKETMIPLPAGVDFPRTDKGNIKRSQLYQVFSGQIEDFYVRLENQETGTLKLDVEQMKAYLMETFEEHMGVKLPSADDDFFAAGVDSLQALQTRGLILKELDLGGNGKRLCQNVVFDTSNVARLAKYLCALRSNSETLDEDEIETMTAMIKKYSAFKTHAPGSASTHRGHIVVCVPLPVSYVILTSLGTHRSNRLFRSPHPSPAPQPPLHPQSLLSLPRPRSPLANSPRSPTPQSQNSIDPKPSRPI